MASNFAESHRAERPHSIEQLAAVADDKIERFPMGSKLVVVTAVAIYNYFTKMLQSHFPNKLTTLRLLLNLNLNKHRC